MNDFQTNEKNDIKIHAEHVDFFYGKKRLFVHSCG